MNILCNRIYFFLYKIYWLNLSHYYFTFHNNFTGFFPFFSYWKCFSLRQCISKIVSPLFTPSSPHSTPLPIHFQKIADLLETTVRQHETRQKASSWGWTKQTKWRVNVSKAGQRVRNTSSSTARNSTKQQANGHNICTKNLVRTQAGLIFTFQCLWALLKWFYGPWYPGIPHPLWTLQSFLSEPPCRVPHCWGQRPVPFRLSA